MAGQEGSGGIERERRWCRDDSGLWGRQTIGSCNTALHAIRKKSMGESRGVRPHIIHDCDRVQEAQQKPQINEPGEKVGRYDCSGNRV